ncbi:MULTISPECIES: SusC/RagA family TonB-linked outer membrane protein [Chitinophagaceae]
MNVKLKKSFKCLLMLLLVLSCIGAWAQKKKVTGTVRSDGRPIGDVTINVKGKSDLTVSDSSGRFSIMAAEGDSLVFNNISFDTQTIAVGSEDHLSVFLIPKNLSAGDEVVVVGYGTQRKATLTGSISVVKGGDLVKSPQANVSNSLAGRVSGVILNNRSGEPGYDGSSIYVRGLATTGNNDVLIVVDGVPGQVGGLERLNPNDIESMSILKDASAAIYGSRAANGVILITTKRGTKGKPRINASFNQGFSSPTRLPKMADAATYAQIRNEIAYYASKDGGLNQVYSDAQIELFRNGTDPLNYPNTDWAKATLKNSTPQSQENVSVSGGSENVKYFVSLGYLNQDGIYKNGVTNYKQYSFRSNIDANVTDRLKVSLYLSGREEDRVYPTAGAGDIFRSIYRAYATIPAIYPNGLPSYGIEGSNPVMMATDTGGINKNPVQVFNGILKGSYIIPGVEGLSIDGFVAIDRSWNFDKNFAKPYVLYSYDKSADSYTQYVVGGSNNLATLTESSYNQYQITANAKINYVRRFGKHSINAFAGIEQSKSTSETFGAYRRNFPTTQTPELSQGGPAATDQTNYGSSYRFTRRSYIGRASYNYAEKYLLDVQMRIDGSSNFPSNSRYGYFPSFSGGWVVSKENFFNIPDIDNLKLRASYGMLGNDNIAQFQYLNTYSFNNQMVLDGTIVSGIDLTKLANSQIHWETAKKLDIGFETRFLRDFSLEFIYFQQKRSNILATRNASIPGVSGIVNPYGSDPLVPDENIGKVNSNGIEATLGYNHAYRNFTWGVSGNFTYAKNKVVFIDEAAGILPYQSQTGHPLNTYLLYNNIGIFRTQDDLDKYPHLSVNQPGDLIYQDYNKDGEITADDMVRSKYGNIPQMTYGLTLNASFKNTIDLAVVFAGQAQVSQYVLPESGTVGNFYSSWADNRWSPNNINGSYPRVDERASSSVNGGLYPSTFWLNDASFLRLKSVELGYSFSGNWMQALKIDRARLYVSGFNLFTITKVKDYDPEGNNGSGQFYPQQRIINVGATLSF